MTTDTPVIAERVDPLEWSEIVETGRSAVSHMDVGRWIIGDLGTMVKARYGEDEFGQFADEINIHRRSAMEYRTVSRYYPPETRDARHNYTAHREAMRLNDLEASLALLQEAAVNLWGVRQIVERAKELKGESPISPGVTVTLTFHVENGRVWVSGLEGVQVSEGVAYTGVLKVRE